MHGNDARKRPAPPWKKRKRAKYLAAARSENNQPTEQKVVAYCRAASAPVKTSTSTEFKILNRAVAVFAVFIVALVVSAEPFEQEQVDVSSKVEISVEQTEQTDQQDLVFVEPPPSYNPADVVAKVGTSDEDAAPLPQEPTASIDLAVPVPEPVEEVSLTPAPAETPIPDDRELPPTAVAVDENQAPQRIEALILQDGVPASASSSPLAEVVITPSLTAPTDVPPVQVAAGEAVLPPTSMNDLTSPEVTQTPISTPQGSAVVLASNPAPVVPQTTPAPQMPQIAGLSLPQVVPTETMTYRVYLPIIVNRADIMAASAAPTPTPSPTPTATPTPTPTPIRPLPYSPADVARALEARPTRTVDRQTKIGVGVYADGGGHAMNELLKLRPGVVLLVDPKPEFAREVRRQLPKAFIFGRRYVEYQHLDNPEVRGAEFADYVAELAVPLKGVVDGWMSYNEPVGAGDIAGYQAYNTFQVAFAKRLQGTYGIGAVAGNDPPGAIDILEYPKYFGEAIRISKFFGLHAYSSPQSQWLREPEAAWYALRYRKIHSALKQAGIKSGPIVLTELGLAKGWREMDINEEQVVADLTWFTDEVAKDDYMLGYTIFGIFTTPGWESFNLIGTSILDRLGRYDPANPLRITVTPQSTPNR